MRRGLLLLRSCMGLGQREPCAMMIGRQYASSSSYNISSGRSIACFLQPSMRQLNASYRPTYTNNVRPLSSSSTSSFEAPVPPTSKGQPIFPDIEFRGPSSSSDKEHPATKRNADEKAVFVVNGSSRGIGLQFVTSLVERTKVSASK